MGKPEINNRILRHSNQCKSFKEYFDTETRKYKNKYRKYESTSPRQWTPEEDEKLIQLVGMNDGNNLSWSTISESIGTRSGKQCRERYINHLDPSINKQEWTADEETVLLKCQKIFGNKWAMFSKEFLHGRTDNSIKNRYHSISNRNKLYSRNTSLNRYFKYVSRQMDDIDYEIIKLWEGY